MSPAPAQAGSATPAPPPHPAHPASRAEKRDIDQHVLGEWIRPGSRVLDLGCGRGVLLEFLTRSRGVHGIGVDLAFDKVLACVRRGVVAHQTDMLPFMREFPDAFFDVVICSRTVQELPEPGAVLREALRVGRSVAIGFANHGYWKNRVTFALSGTRLVNEVNPHAWADRRPQNPVSLREFEDGCASAGIRIARRATLRGDWRTPCRFLPNLRAGYALYELTLATA